MSLSYKRVRTLFTDHLGLARGKYIPVGLIQDGARFCVADGKGGWKEWDTPGAYVYGTGPAVDPVGLLTEMMDAVESVGLPPSYNPLA